MLTKLSKILIGKRLKNSDLGQEKYSIFWGIPIFASDAISSVSYASEEILLVLMPVLGILSFNYFLPIVAAILLLLAILIICYRQTIDAYPQGGGAYIIAKENLGPTAGLVAGAALIIGYILTVAVSSCAGAAAITAAFPDLLPYKAYLAFALVTLLSWGNLRGISSAGMIFGIPTYLFMLTMLMLIGAGLYRYYYLGYSPETTATLITAGQDSLLFLILRGFASGCTALTGVETVSNGVPSFKAPAQRNAKIVLMIMGAVVAIIFAGISWLVQLYQIVPIADSTVISQLAAAVFGRSNSYFLVQFMTVIILGLASNAAFAGMPLLTALMSRDGYLPRQLKERGSRLSFSNGIGLLFVTSSLLIFIFAGDQHLLLPLYASSVFLSFMLSQLGMVVHWYKKHSSGWKLKAVINGSGTIITGITLGIIFYMKFAEGAWVTALCILLLTLLMQQINRHYTGVAKDLALTGPAEADVLIKRPHPCKVILPVQSLSRSFIKTYNCAVSYGFKDIELFHITDSEQKALELKEKLDQLDPDINFSYAITEYRNCKEVLLQHIREEADRLPQHAQLVVIMGELVETKIYKQILHNQTTHSLKAALSKYRNVSVFSVPYIIR